MPKDTTKDQLVKQAQDLQQKMLSITEEAKRLTQRTKSLALSTGATNSNNPFIN